MSYESIRLEKGMYRQSGKTFAQVLEGLDPSENYHGTALEGTDAFQRQLKRFGIRAKGPGSDTVEKFFATTDSAVLFPEFISRVVRQGMDEADLLSRLCATVTSIDAMDYRSIYSVPTEEEKKPMDVGEGAALPAAVIRTREHLVQLKKRGRLLTASYEALRFQKLDLFSVMLRQMGAAIQKTLVSDAVEVLISGDGNSNAAATYRIGTSPMSGTSGTLTYAQLVEFWASFSPYEMNTLVLSAPTTVKLLQLPEMQNPAAGLDFQGSGRLITPLGAQILRTDAISDGRILALDRRFALEMVQAGEVSVEFDKLIDRQMEMAAITSICGFSKICNEATAVLTI